MIKVEVLEDFNLKDFNKLKKLERNSGRNQDGKLFKKDTFECDEEMCEYLCGKNPLNKAVVQVVEVIPKKEEVKEILKELSTLDTINEVKNPIKKTTKKKSSKK